MGREIGRYTTVEGIRKGLTRLDGDAMVRFRDGDAVYPGVCVMVEDGTGIVNFGHPFPVREQLAEIDRCVRKIDGRRPPPKPAVWVLVRRYEWEDQAQQTEYCDTFVFSSWTTAVRKAASLLRSDLAKYGDGVTSEPRPEEKALLADFRTEFPRHLVQLTDSDNVVYELYRRSVR